MAGDVDSELDAAPQRVVGRQRELEAFGSFRGDQLAGPPLEDRSEFVPDGARPVVRLFAQDATVRQTAVASALGLVVTAFAFFRGPYLRPPRAPTDVIGA